MSAQVAEILLSLFVLNLGVALGAGIYEARVVVPQWAGTPPESVRRWNAEAGLRPDPGRHFWAFVTTVPLTMLTLLNGVAAWQAQAAWAGLWLGAVALVLAERLGTFFYFIPTALRLKRVDAFSDSKVRAMVSRWVHLNYVRNASYLVAFVMLQLVLASS